MGRRLPSESNPLIHHHPALSLYLFIASIAATIAIVAALCGGRSKNPASSTSPKASSPTASSSFESSESTQQPKSSLLPPISSNSSEKPQEQEWPTSKDDISLSLAPHELMVTNTAATKRKLVASLSMKVPEALNKIKEHHKIGHASKEDDSLWRKRIMIGERCRMPGGGGGVVGTGGDHQDDAAATAVNDEEEKAKQLHINQPKRTMSRTTSFFDSRTIRTR